MPLTPFFFKKDKIICKVLVSLRTLLMKHLNKMKIYYFVLIISKIKVL